MRPSAGSGSSTPWRSCVLSGRHEPGHEGIVVPDPVPPIIVAAKPARRWRPYAGRCADAVNFHDWQSDLPGAIATASATGAGSRRRTAFVVTLEVPFEEA